MIAGVDEVGRGPLAGPVVAAAVVLAADDPMLDAYRDSKRLTARKRRKLYHHLKRHARAVRVAQASVAEIERLNILQATMLAMHRAVVALPEMPRLARVDGNRAPELPCPVETVIGGDDSRPEIAAASIVAKVVRDRLMGLLDVRWPAYGFAAHKGYGTAAHLAALAAHGPCPAHRSGFAPVARVLAARGG
ncbi:MAG: ribonuclease HII [Mariprofundaceae bacterium]